MDSITSKDENIMISIIFPSYNGEKFLKRNFESIKSLPTLSKLEIVIIDNNSTDNTISIIEEYSKSLRIKLIKQNTNLGFTRACNLGVHNANGKYMFITNQDVIFTPNFFEKLINIYQTYKKDKEFIISPAFLFEGDGIHYFGAKIHILGFSYTPELKKALPEKRVIKLTERFSGGALFITKDFFLEMGGFDPELFMYCEDTDLSLRVLRKGLKIYTTNDPFLIHQKHEWTFNDFRYYFLERNRYIVVIKNISNIKKLIPYFFLMEIPLIFQSIIINKFKLRVRIYYELFRKRKYLRQIRDHSKKMNNLLQYQHLSRTLDPILLGDLQNIKVFNVFLKVYNFLLKHI